MMKFRLRSKAYVSIWQVPSVMTNSCGCCVVTFANLVQSVHRLYSTDSSPRPHPRPHPRPRPRPRPHPRPRRHPRPHPRPRRHQQ